MNSTPLHASLLREQQLTHNAGGHMLTNIGVWSPDSKWIVYDTRTSIDGSQFNGQSIERVHVETGRVELLYRSTSGAHCGVVTFHPTLDRVVFILGPEHPTKDWSYGPCKRQGVIVDCANPGRAINLDARDIVPPFTPGALRGGTHVHTYSDDGLLVASTYEDSVLDSQVLVGGSTEHRVERNLRGIAISVVDRAVQVPLTHPRNHSGTSFTFLATRLWDDPVPGSDQILRACEEGWIGKHGYIDNEGRNVRYAIAFQGTVVGSTGKSHVELFVLDLPNDLSELTNSNDQTILGRAIVGTTSTRPTAPAKVRQWRLTNTQHRTFPGVLSQPRHWVRSTPDGSLIAFLAKDDQGIVQIYGVSPSGGELRQITRDSHSVCSAFSFSPDGKWIAYASDESLFMVDVATGQSTRLTQGSVNSPIRPEAIVFSPDSQSIAYLRTMDGQDGSYNQVFCFRLP